jgi:aryl-alcohol dehydrogenase-like predicted oxidoreductase
MKQPTSADRRNFLKTGGAVAAGFLASAMPTRNLGKTGYKVGIFSLGGQAALEKANNFDVAVPIIERALDLGVNYFDTSSIYGGPDRWSEQYYGR